MSAGCGDVASDELNAELARLKISVVLFSDYGLIELRCFFIYSGMYNLRSASG